jgi:hypothetical protein
VFAAPDLVPRDLRALYDQCSAGKITLVATVLNQGAAGAPPGVPVTFYWANGGTNQVVATVMTQGELLPGAGETVSYTWMPAAPTGPLTVLVVVDDAGAPMTGVVNECDETNNVSQPIAVGCPSIQ